MAVLPQPFDPQSVVPASSAGNQLPISDDKGYLVQITNSEWRPTQGSDNNGRLVFALQILDGDHVGQTGDYGFNLIHTNPQTVEIARSELSAVCHVIGIFSPVTDTAVLHTRPFRVKVRQQRKDPQYTEVYGVMDQQGRTPTEVKNAGPAAAAGPPVAAAPAPVAAPAPAMPAVAPAPVAAPAMPPVATPAPAAVPAPAPYPPAAPPLAPAPAPAPALAGAPAPAGAAPGGTQVPPWERPQ